MKVYCQAPSGDLLLGVAEKFISKYFPEGEYKIASARPEGTDTVVTMYIVNLMPEGWLLMSADQRVQPVLGFSFTGKFLSVNKTEKNPQYLWINQYEYEINTIMSQKGITKNQEWEEIIKYPATGNGMTSDIFVNSFIKVNWGQGSSWNQFCPVDANGPGGHTYAGCVAVSMAQAMSVYKKPANGYGTKSYTPSGYNTQFVNFGETAYKWDSMSLSVADKYNALLLYHCAVSVEMEFGADGSGAPTLNVSSALKNYFYYSRRTSYKKRLPIDQDWMDILNQQLISGRPVIYSGDADDGKPGHAFNIDGVINTYYHINWGWSGSNNGYFTINALRPGNNDFTKNHAAIIGIQPYYFPTDIILDDTIIHANLPKGNTVGVLKVIDEATDNIYSVKMVSDSTYDGSGWLMDFYLDGDTVKTGRIFSTTESPTDTLFISVTDKFNNYISKKLVLKLGGSSTGINNPIGQSESSFTIYPNPATDHIFFGQRMIMDIIEIRIYTTEGMLIQINNCSALDEGIALSNLRPGLYILETELENHLIIRKKFIKK
jgi:hypothetical protein